MLTDTAPTADVIAASRLRCLIIPDTRAEAVSAQAAERDVPHAPDRSAAAASRERLGRVDARPFPPGEYDVVVVGSGPGGLQAAYSLARAGITRCAVHLARRGARRHVPALPRLPAPDQLDEARRAVRAGHARVRVVRPQQPRRRRARAPGAHAASSWTATFDVPARAEMEAALAEFAARGDVRVRYGCEWLIDARDEDGFVLGTSDGEYRCRVCVFAIGMTEPWTPPIPGLDAAPHYARHDAPERYQGKSVFIVGKRNSGFELAQGLLPVGETHRARRRRGRSTRRCSRSRRSASATSRRSTSTSAAAPGATSSTPRSSASSATRTDTASDAPGRHGTGELELEADEVIAATGFRAPLRDLPSIGVAMVNDGRLPAQTPYWESVSVPGIYFAGNVTQASSGPAQARRDEQLGIRPRVPLQRARPRAAHRREALRARARAAPAHRDEVVPLLLAELATRRSSGAQKGYLARVVELDAAGRVRDDGIVPLADFVDRDGGDACAVAVEYGADGTISPVVYVRRGGRLVERPLPPHPLHAFGTDEHRRELAACLAPLLSSETRASA